VKILTTVKRVTDPNMKIKIKPDNSGIITEGVEYQMNSFDEYGVEEAIRIKEEQGGEVVAVSVGSSDSTKELRTAMAMGADRAILVETDEKLDSDAVARVLAKVVDREEPDVILMGKQSVDSDRSQAAQLLASYLDWPQATFAFDVEIEDGWATVGREVDGGTATKRIQLPGIITADLRLNEPRYASLPGIMKAKRKPLDTLTPDELGVDVAPKLNTLHYEQPPEPEAGEIVEDVDELIDRLQNDANVI